jgi:hypothetical protein
MSNYKCPQYSGRGAAVGRAWCEFFAKADAHPDVKYIGIAACLVILLFCARYLNTGKVF